MPRQELCALGCLQAVGLQAAGVLLVPSHLPGCALKPQAAALTNVKAHFVDAGLERGAAGTRLVAAHIGGHYAVLGATVGKLHVTWEQQETATLGC